MSRFLSRALTGAAATLLGAAAFATPPVTLDTEQKAAAAVITASQVEHNTLSYHWQLLERTVFYTNRALHTASSVTTPAGLMATPAGIEVPCPVSGKLTARMAPRLPRVFRYEWHDCAFLLDGWPATLDGPGEVVMLADDFAPKNVASIRLGSLAADLVQTQEISFPGFAVHKRFQRNLRLTGIIPLTVSPFAIGGSSSSFAYVATGFADENNINEFPGTDLPPQEFGSRLDHEFVTYSGRYAYNEDATRYEEDVRPLFGKLTFTRRDTPPYGVTTEVSRFDGLRIHHVLDFNDLTKTLSLDGRIDYTWSPNFGAGCLNGSYQFRTNTPLSGQAFAFPEFDSGDLTINGTSRTTFFSAASVPAGLPVPVQGMLIHTEAQGVGAFNYDAPSLIEGLRAAAHCM